jgi:hypothetical protein
MCGSAGSGPQRAHPEDAMFVSCLLSVSLALASAAASPPPSEKTESAAQTLWLVQPLYPGQDALVKRAEEGIGALLPKELQGQHLIGREALAGHLKGKRGELACVSGEAKCREPLEAYLDSLGLERVVLVQVGQDDAGYRFRAASVRPATGARAQGETANPAFEKALAGALVKFLSINAVVDAVTVPAGATVYLDGVKVGTTPMSTEVLPGEHTVRFELASHLPKEETRVFGSLEKVKLEAALEKVPARLVVKAQPEGTQIRVDGKPVGTDAVDQGIQPGTRVLTLMLDGYEPHEVKAEIAPGATYTLEHTMKPTSMQSFKLAMRRRKEATMARQSYLEVSYELLDLRSGSLKSRPAGTVDGDLRSYRTGNVTPGPRSMRGLGLEYGRYGQYFGVLLVGGTYFSTGDTWGLSREPDNTSGPAGVDVGSAQLLSLRVLQPQLRYVLGPVSFALQAGVDLRGMLLKDLSNADGSTEDLRFDNGLYALDVNVSAQAAARIFVYEGLYASVAYQYSLPLLNNIGATSDLRGGLGYAF